MNCGVYSTWPCVLTMAATVLAIEPPSQSAPTLREQRVLFITAKDSERCRQELDRLGQPGGEFQKMRSKGWKIGSQANNHLQIVDRDMVSELIRRLNVKDFPVVVCVNGSQVVRSFTSGCTTPLDAWTFGWLAKGINERPPGSVAEVARVRSTGNYPLRGNHWSIDEAWNPTREQVISHLRGPAHGHSLLSTWKIESWSYEELRSLHDNLHEQELSSGSYAGMSYGSDRNANPFSAGRKITGH